MIQDLVDSPLLVLAISFLVLWLAAHASASWVRRTRADEAVHTHFEFVLSATLTLLGLIIGFNLLTAINRYDLRKNYEEAEANAIGTQFVRADLLPAADAQKLRKLLRSYVDQRLLFYTTRDQRELGMVNTRTAQLQAEMWATVLAPAAAQPTPIMALAVSGMNDVLNAQGYTQSAWWNRIPLGAWYLMCALAISCNLLIGYGVRGSKGVGGLLLVIPFVVSISFFLIADVDSPRSGVIRVLPQNLLAIVETLPAQ
jgi:hypothetical protein